MPLQIFVSKDGWLLSWLSEELSQIFFLTKTGVKVHIGNQTVKYFLE